MDVDKCSKDKNVDVSGDESEDQGEHLNFGTFQNMKIQRLWTVHLNDNISAVINEHGSNFYNYKYTILYSFSCY
jgi:hypothetical protein